MGRLLKSSIRASDQIFTLSGHTAILMAHTANNEARQAVERYRRMCNGQVDVRYSIASYPDDGGTVADILKTAEQRLAQAKRGEFGTIVSSRDNSNRALEHPTISHTGALEGNVEVEDKRHRRKEG